MGNENFVGNNFESLKKPRQGPGRRRRKRVSQINPTLLLFVDRRVLLGVLILFPRAESLVFFFLSAEEEPSFPGFLFYFPFRGGVL